jgi:hypothetical protein
MRGVLPRKLLAAEIFDFGLLRMRSLLPRTFLAPEFLDFSLRPDPREP